MNFSTLTLDERERLAYAEGYTEAAALLGQMADLERERDKMQEKNDALTNQLNDTGDKYRELIDERDDLEDMTARLLTERDEAQEVAKAYRAALMALEAEVTPAMRKFIREVLA